tara:strand:+ start:14657 stop:15169 length:513 start_codon:yes stop_codon:yes gene_type:complete
MDSSKNRALRRRLRSLLLKMNIPRLQEETLDLKWIKSNLIHSNPGHISLGEAIEITHTLLDECRKKGNLMTAEKIFSMNLEEAKREKWVNGVKEYRGGDHAAEFVGDPVVEMYGEIVDAMLYNDEAAARGFALYAKFNEVFTDLAKALQSHGTMEESSDEVHQPTDSPAE